MTSGVTLPQGRGRARTPSRPLGTHPGRRTSHREHPSRHHPFKRVLQKACSGKEGRRNRNLTFVHTGKSPRPPRKRALRQQTNAQAHRNHRPGSNPEHTRSIDLHPAADNGPSCLKATNAHIFPFHGTVRSTSERLTRSETLKVLRQLLPSLCRRSGIATPDALRVDYPPNLLVRGVTRHVRP